MNALLLAATLQVNPLDIHANVGRLELRGAPHVAVGYAFPWTITGYTFAVVPGTRDVTLRMWSSTGEPAPRLWTLAFEAENSIPYEGPGRVLSRVHVIGGGDTGLLDYVGWEAVLVSYPQWGAANRSGHVPVVQGRINSRLYVGRCFGPIMLRLGVNQREVNVALVAR